jgi:hypothetical protein
MPRLTRAQLRAQVVEVGPQIIHEDHEAIPAAITHDYDPFSTEVSDRPPLGEIHTFPNPESTAQPTPTKKGQGCDKVRPGGKENIKLVLVASENPLTIIDQVVLKDESQSEGNSAAEIAAEALRKGHHASKTTRVPVDTLRPKTPASTAAQEASKALVRSPEKRLIAVQGSMVGTPRFDPTVHTQVSFGSQAALQSSEDSFVGSIKTRTPRQMMTTEQHTGDGPDSFVEDITSRSPSKYRARIEDSVEAIDALEEAIEQVSHDLPKPLDASLESPVKSSTPRVTKTSNPRHAVLPATKRPAPSPKSAAATQTSARGNTVTRKPVPRVSSARPQARPSIVTTIKSRSSTQPTASTATAKQLPQVPIAAAPKRTASRKLSTAKPGFIPAKSSKAPTKSNFTLPGDAISAKMKAQREEKLKKEEEAKAESAKKREFKARPVPKTTSALAGTGKGRISSVLPRETAASRARMSLATARKDEEGKENVGPAAMKVFAGSALASLRSGSGSAAKKSFQPLTTAQSDLSVSKTRPRASVPNMTVTAGRVTKRTIVPANSSATRRSTTDYGAAIKTRRPILHPPITPSKPRQSTAQAKSARGNHRNGSDGYSTATKPTTTPTTAAESLATTTTATATTTGAKRTAKGREVFSRGKLAEEEQQKQKREKEEAARKARAAAAEKGRLASRQWAEKQKQRKTPTVLAKTTTTTTMADGTGDVTVMGGGEAVLADGEASC